MDVGGRDDFDAHGGVNLWVESREHSIDRPLAAGMEQLTGELQTGRWRAEHSGMRHSRWPVVLGAALLVVFLAGCSSKTDPDRKGQTTTEAAGSEPATAVRVSSPRALHLASDGRLIVADAGTGKNDGRVLAIRVGPKSGANGELEALKVDVLMDGLPSSKAADVVRGVQGAQIGRDGVVCAAIGKAVDAAGKAVAGFATVRCSNGKTYDMAAAEAAQNPDGKGVDSDPSDIFFNGQDSWFVSDRGANVVWRIGPDGSINVQTVFTELAELPRGQAAAPAGMHVVISGRGQASVAVALAGGAIAAFAPGAVDRPIVFAQAGTPVALWDDGKTTLVLLPGAGANDGSVFNITLATTVASGLVRPAGFTRLDDGRLVVSEAGRLRVITPK